MYQYATPSIIFYITFAIEHCNGSERDMLSSSERSPMVSTSNGVMKMPVGGGRARRGHSLSTHGDVGLRVALDVYVDVRLSHTWP